MKKGLLIFTLVFALILICSCHVETGHTEHFDKDGDGKCDGCDLVLKLSVPTVIVDEEGNASWQAIANAVSYVYKIGDKELATKNLSIKLNDGESIQVKAIAESPYIDSEYSTLVTYEAPIQVVYGLPTPEEGFYMTDADAIEEGNTRYVIYTTNATKATEDSVIAIIKGEKTENGYVYGEQKVILEGGTGWDQYLVSASITKGAFKVDGVDYSFMLAYAANESGDNKVNQIGLAFAKTIDGEYVKLPNPVVTFDASVYGANMVGCYAPSVVNYTKEAGIRVFYTLADAYGHFAYFIDFDLTNVDSSKALKGAKAMITNDGELQGGDAVTMFPNADFAYDSVNKVFYAVKDVSPSPAIKPSVADEWELCHIAEEELYTTDKGEGFISDLYKDYFDLECDRAYSACIVSDMYGHKLSTTTIIYGVCEIGNAYLFTQHFAEYVVE